MAAWRARNATSARIAGSEGTTGPNRNPLAPLSEATIITEISNGGSALTGGAAAKDTTQMVGYEGAYTAAQIDDIAAYASSATCWQRRLSASPRDDLTSRRILLG